MLKLDKAVWRKDGASGLADASLSQGRSKWFSLKPYSITLIFLLDQVPDEGTIFNLYSIETNLGLLSEFREFVMLIENSISSLPEIIQKLGE